MAQQVITFDPDVAVPMGVNLTMFSGADFNTTFTVRTSAGSSIDFSNYTGTSRSSNGKSSVKISTREYGKIYTIWNSDIWIKSDYLLCHFSNYLVFEQE